MKLSHLWTAWPITGPWHLSPLVGGTNNSVWRADAAEGRSYVLRLFSDLTYIPRHYYETALLQALSARELPFLLPLPLQANTGDTLIRFEPEPDTTMLASLYPLLPGTMHDLPPERHDLLSAVQAASTLASLDSALATLPPIPFPADFTPLPTFGELARFHPSVPDPLLAVEQLPITHTEVKQIHAILTDVMQSVPALYAQLPQQLLHRDYDPGNILMDQQRVTAVLDFEFASTDLRILDLVVALSWWPLHLMDTGQEWDLIDAFSSTYIQQIAPGKEEILAIPAILRLRDAASLIHRIGRYLSGQETDERIQARIQHTLWRESWLSANQHTLLQHLLRSFHHRNSTKYFD